MPTRSSRSYARPACGFWFRAQDDPFAWRDRLGFARAGLAELMLFSAAAAALAAGMATAALLLHWAFWLPLAIVLGYMLANPMDTTTLGVCGAVLAFLMIPLLLKHHHAWLIATWNMSIVLFFLPLYYQFWELPPPYPFKYGNWYAGIWAAAGVVLTILVMRGAPERLKDVDRVYVDDDAEPSLVA